MSGAGTEGQYAASGPIRGWADIAEAYWPAVMSSKKRSVRCPKVSVCMVANRGSRDLQTEIDRVVAQRFDDLEIVIVCTEGPRVAPDVGGAAKNKRVLVIRNESTSPLGSSFNLAVRHSNGQFVKLLCPDGTLLPDCIAVQARALDENRGVALVAARTDYIDPTGTVVTRQPGFARIVGIHSAQHVVKTIVRSGGNLIGPPSGAMFRRKDFQHCGGFRTDLLYLGELDLWIRLLRIGEFLGLPETLALAPDRDGSGTDFASALVDLPKHIQCMRELTDDPLWSISAGDRIVGNARAVLISVRRTYKRGLLSVRAHEKMSHPRQCH